tara:strand:- start:264 stop:500 length:237 start_codon:yes stop_codon:yes gene_type:complete
MSKKEFFKAFTAGILFALLVIVFVQIFLCFIDNQIDYNIIIEESVEDKCEQEKLDLLIEASEYPERFTDEEIIELLIN